MIKTQTYYDAFAHGYENARTRGYHAVLDRFQIELTQPLCVGRDILEVGCGTGLLLRATSPLARTAIGIDVSTGMLSRAQSRGLNVVQASATELPFPDQSFDLVYSFKVLPHIESIHHALKEVKRVLRPGGRALLEFYNRHSLRYAVKRIKRPDFISAHHVDTDVFTRYDSPEEAIDTLPSGLELVEMHGFRIVTPVGALWHAPGLRLPLIRLERLCRDHRLTRRAGGFLVLSVCRTDSI